MALVFRKTVMVSVFNFAILTDKLLKVTIVMVLFLQSSSLIGCRKNPSKYIHVMSGFLKFFASVIM
jgi:hypothetical protein